MPISLQGNDTSSFNDDVRLNGTGRLLVGAAPPAASFSALLQNASGAGDDFGILGFAANTASPADGDALGDIRFSDNGHAWSAGIRAVREGGAWSGTSHPTRLEFYTTANSSNAPALRMRINSAGRVDMPGAQLAIGSIASVILTTTNGGGASIFRSWFGDVATSGLIHAVEVGTNNYCILSAHKQNTASGVSCTVLANRNLTVQATNNQGTVSLTGFTNTNNVRMFSIMHQTQFA